MLGTGNYDPECTRARISTEADVTMLLVVGGRKGGGASVQVANGAVGELLRLPAALRALADHIESIIVSEVTV